MARYLAQVATFLAPLSVEAADNAFRQLARWLVAHTEITAVAEISRDDIEDFKVWLADQPGNKGAGLSANTSTANGCACCGCSSNGSSSGTGPTRPTRNPVIAGDIPPRPEPLPKFLDDRDAARLMAAARAAADPRDRLVVEVLARTGLRAGELCDLEADAVVRIGDGHWLRVPIGKLRNDRYVPLHPQLVELLADWTAQNLEHIRRHHRLVADQRGTLDRHLVVPASSDRVGRHAGVKVHPHQLRHTLATQAINRGMRLEAIAALLGHRSMDMTLTYARIADRVVADEYAAVSARDRRALQHGQSPRRFPPTSKPRPWPNSVDAKPTPACSATGSAPAPSNSTAAWNPRARPAPTSRPAPSSSPSCSANATTPATTTNPTVPHSSTASSKVNQDGP